MAAGTIFCWAHLFVQPPQARYFAGHICLCNDRRHKILLGTSVCRHKILLGTSVCAMTAGTRFCWAHLFVQPPQAQDFAGHMCLCNGRRHKILLGTSVCATTLWIKKSGSNQSVTTRGSKVQDRPNAEDPRSVEGRRSIPPPKIYNPQILVWRKSHAILRLSGGLKGDRKVFLEEVLSGIATFRSPEKSSGRSQKRPEGFFGGSIKRNATFRSLPHLAIIIL